MNINTIKELYDKNTPSMQTVQLVREALELFDSSRSSAIVIIDDNKHPKGILTERDITKYAGHWDEIIELSVGEVMTSPVTTINQEHDFRDAYMQMSENGFRHLMVVKEDGTLAGILDEGHFLRHLTPEQLLAVKEVKLVMSKNVTTVETTQSVADTIKIMTEAKISSIIIVRDKKPLGILTERDTVRLARHGDASLEAPITEYMTAPLKTIHEESSVIDAEHILTHEHIRHLIVVDEKGELSGIVSQHDLVKGISGIYVEMLRDTILKQSNLLHKTYNQLEKQSVLNNIFDSFSDRLIIACDINGLIKFTNADICQCLDTVLQKGNKLDESVQCFNSSISDAVLNGDVTSTVHAEPVVYDEKEEKHYFKTSYAPIYSQKKLLQGFLFTAEDVTSEKQSVIEREEQNLLLKEKEQQLLQAQKLGKIGSWKFDIVKNKLDWSDEIFNIFEMDISKFRASYEAFLDTIHPEDRDEVNQAYIESLQNRLPYSITHRLLMKDGSIKWVTENCTTTFDENKNPLESTGTVQDITQEKKTKILLEEQNLLLQKKEKQLLQYSHIVSATTDLVVFIDKEYKFIAVNDAYLSYHKTTREEVVNVSVADVIGQANFYAMKPHLDKAFEGLEFTLELNAFVDSEGNKRYEEIRFYPYKNGNGETEAIVLNIRDNTEKQIALQNEKKLLDLVDSSSNEIYVFDKESLRFTYANYGALSNLQYTLQELQTMYIYDIKPEYPKETFIDFIQPLLQKEVSKLIFETHHLRKDKTTYPIEVNLQLLKTIDGNEEFLAIITDITERKRVEKQLKQQEEMMIIQSRQAAMGEMISMIAHQWRQPLSVVSMMVNNLLLDIDMDTFDTVVAKEDFAEINAQLQYMSATIDDFRNFFKPSKEVEQDSALNILQDIMKIIGPSLDSNSIRTEIECDSMLMLQTYKSELKQVIINILSNAKDALKNRQVENKMIKISAKAENENIVFSIFNNGPKIDSELLDRIFEPYFTTKEILGGTGIGLYMSKSIIEKHMHGNIEAKNINKGVAFTITVPKVLEGKIDV